MNILAGAGNAYTRVCSTYNYSLLRFKCIKDIELEPPLAVNLNAFPNKLIITRPNLISSKSINKISN